MAILLHNIVTITRPQRKVKEFLVNVKRLTLLFMLFLILRRPPASQFMREME